MRVDLYVYGVLLACGLGTAYWASMPAPEASEDAVSVVSIDPKAVTEVHFKTKDIDAVAAKRANDNHYLVTYTKTETPPVNPHAPKDDKTPPPTPKTTTDHFLANDKMDEFLKSFNPLYAVRVLDKVDEQQLADYGLKDATDSLVIKSAGNKDYVLHIGKRSYGSRNRFAQEDGAKGKILLIEDVNLENIERAPMRLYERRIVSFEMADVGKAEISADGHSKRIEHSARDKGGELIWTDEDDATAKPKPAYDNFMDRISKLRLTDFADSTDEAALKDLKPFLTIAFEKNGKTLDHVTFKKAAGDKPAYWVTSDFLQTYARVQAARVEPIEKDISSLVSEAPPKS